jgi:transcriptional regulator NrdR family protein
MELTYTQHGDYMLPDLQMDAQSSETLGKYGRMRKNFLKQHRKGKYSEMLLTGNLTGHLLETDRTARQQMEQTVQQLAIAQGVNEALKASDQMAWVRRMNSIRHSAEELILAELIYS